MANVISFLGDDEGVNKSLESKNDHYVSTLAGSVSR